jgi:short-subunit dehydrogenase
MAVYYASKAFVLSFSQALRAELATSGIRVTTLCPGPVPTEFQARAGGVPNQDRGGVLKRTAQEVALEGYRGLMAGKATVTPGWGNKLVTFFPRFLPRAFLADQIAKVQAR